MPRKTNEPMPIISIHMPTTLIEKIDDYVRRGLFPSRSEFIRFAVQLTILLLETGKIDRIFVALRGEGHEV